MKAYHVEESRKGVTWLIVWADSAKEAAEKVRNRGARSPDIEVTDFQDDPGGIRSIRRAPEEDRHPLRGPSA